MSLDALLDPASVAVVGASDDPTSWGYWLARGALAGRHRREVHLVNTRVAASGGHVQGRPVLASVAEVPSVDLVAVAVPAAAVAGVVEEGLARGARAFVVITAGMGAAAERALARRVRAGGARLLGPTCLGLYDAASSLSLVWGAFPSGDLGLVSQSGQVGIEVGQLLARTGGGFSRFVSVGSQVDLTAADLLGTLVDDPGTRVVAVYLESLGDVPQLLVAARALRAAGRPVLLLSPGASQAGARAAVSHTASLVSGDDVVDAVCRAGGVARVRTPAALVHAATVAAAAAPVRGPRVAVISDSGGQGVIAADLLESRGLVLPVLSPQAQAALVAVLPGGAAVTTNPVDLAGSGESDLHCYARAVETVAASGEVDVVVLSGYFGRYAVDAPSLAPVEDAVAGHLAGVASRHGVPLLVHAMADPSDPGPTVSVLRAARVPVFGTIDDLVDGLAPVALASAGPSPVRTPEPVAAQAGSDRRAGYAGARSLLEAFGLRFPAAVTLTAAEVEAGGSAAVVAAAAAVGYPVALKATGLAHKTESGGVVLGLGSARAVATAADDLRARLGDAELTVEAMATGPGAVGVTGGGADSEEVAVELLVGARRDPAAGVVVTVGAGGVLAELVGDVAVDLGPLDRQGAAALLARTSVARLLAGWRGGPPLDTSAAADAVVSVGRALAAAPHLAELEVNPLRVTSSGAIALDAWAGADGGSPGTAG